MAFIFFDKHGNMYKQEKSSPFLPIFLKMNFQYSCNIIFVIFQMKLKMNGTPSSLLLCSLSNDCSAECTYKQLRGGHISQSLHGIIYIANIITWHLLNQKKLAEWCWATTMAHSGFWRTTKGVLAAIS